MMQRFMFLEDRIRRPGNMQKCPCTIVCILVYYIVCFHTQHNALVLSSNVSEDSEVRARVSGRRRTTQKNVHNTSYLTYTHWFLCAQVWYIIVHIK